MGFEELVVSMNDSTLNTFGQEFTLSRVESEPTGDRLKITGILEAGIEPDDRPPGDGSTYARLWTVASNISPAPAKGDEISSVTTVYKILRMEENAGGGLWMLLRQDRAVIS